MATALWGSTYPGMLSQFFILSGRGDTVVGRDYRHDVPRTSHDTCFRLVTCGAGVGDGEAAPPVILHDGVNYFHIKVRNALWARRHQAVTCC